MAAGILTTAANASVLRQPQPVATMKSDHHSPEQTPEEVLNELRALLSEAEKIFSQATADDSGDVAAELRRRFEAAQERLTSLYQDARARVAGGVKSADEAIRENPYQTLAIALGIGLLLGVLLGRRSK